MGTKRNRICAGRAIGLVVAVLLLGSFLLGQERTEGFAGMGKNCANCHAGGSSGSVESQDASGAARTDFSAEPAGTVTIVLLGKDLPDSGAFVALEMGSSYDIVQSFRGAKNSGDPGTLYVVNDDENDRDPDAGTVKASIELTLKAQAAEGSYSCLAMLGYKGPQGVEQASQATITVAAAPVDTPPAFGAVDFPLSVPLDTPISVRAPVTDDGGVAGVVLSYKGTGATQYTAIDMALSAGDAKSGTWEAEIPGQALPGTVHFNLNASDGTLFAASPGGGADHAVSVLSPGNPEITHRPVGTAYIGAEIPVTATVRDAPDGVLLHYKGVGQPAYSSVPMNRTSGDGTGPSEYAAGIPAQAAKGFVSYYINATNGSLGANTPEYRIQVLSMWEPELEHVPVASAYAGREVVLAANARNVAAVTIWYKGVGDYYFRSMPMEQAGPGPNGTLSFSAALPAQNTAGSLSYYVNATNGTLFNSTGVFQVQISEALDIVLVGVTFSEPKPSVHEELIIHAKVRNNSTRDLSGVQVSFLDDYYTVAHARYIGLVSNLTIPANTTIDVRAWWLPQVNGTHIVRVKADSTEVIKETDEGNNELVREIDVGPAKEEESLLSPFHGEFFGVIWPVLAVAAGFAIGVAAHLLSRRPATR